MNRRNFLGALGLLIASGCAQRDWTDILVTVDVAGRWTGTYSPAQGRGGGLFYMTLRQTDPKAMGNVEVIGPDAAAFSGPIEGTVSGDVLKFSRPDGRLRGEVIVAGDAMTGTVTFATGTRAVRLQRQR